MKTRNDLKAQEGSVLLVALMVITSLAALGMVVVFNIYQDALNAGNMRTAKQGYYLAEAGLAGPLAQASMDQELFMNFLQNNGFVVRMSDISANFFDSASDGSFGPEFARPDAATFISYFSDPVDSNRMPGYSVSGFCFRMYTVTADGYLGTDLFDSEDPKTVVRSAQRRFVSHIFMGPFNCAF